MALQNDLALVLESKTIRMEAPVPGRRYVGVEIPNKNSRLVTLREILESKEYQAAKNKSRLTVALGKDVAGAVRVGDLDRKSTRFTSTTLFRSCKTTSSWYWNQRPSVWKRRFPVVPTSA